ncbi:reverse transcriptase [Polaribacter batillariae]|uniref:Reverse transcriptase n=1 Tax=Polaribacter batillariae TaxID=2808900 RepID=A0ABX7SSC6_9FLAO|nr:RNA-directed DNA polymerase [Polaribacter batillariae]QTD36777.1 reverse transcriptase [Polaribacter batillariae]
MQNLYYQLYLSYLEARKNKRNTNNQLAFEIDVETKLYELAQQITNKTYIPKPSIAFMVYKPVQREIFAVDFSDRVVNHLIYRCIYQDHVAPYLIPDSYSCRKGKGTLHGTKRLNHFIKSCSNNYKQEAYILKLDIKGYFMNMSHSILYNKVIQFLKPKIRYLGLDYTTLNFLLQKTIFTNVAIGCRIKGNRSNWKTLPKDKSLFSKPNGIGLPIGNLTSQVFGNIYLNQLDHYIKNTLQIKYYSRYVDDMVFVHKNKNLLKNIIPLVQSELDNIGLTIHPKNYTYSIIVKVLYF